MVTIGARDLPRSMKNSYGCCKVLSQQTILNFSQHPPAALGAKHIPLCVVEERAGERRFAMATETQLRFNLDVPPVPANLASNIQPQPSPVVIDKPAGVHAGMNTPGTPGNPAFSDRLALAVKLARRDLRNGLILRPSYCATSEEQAAVRTYPSAPLVSWREYTGPPFQTPVAQQLLPTPGFDDGRVVPSPSYRPVHTTEAAVPDKPVAAPPAAGTTRQYPSPLEQVTDEIVRLRKELTAEVKKLKQLKMGRPGPGMKEVRPSDNADFERQGWEAKEDEEGKLKRKVAEQTARNTRMLYDLQQQICELQKDAGVKPPHVRHTKKSQAMHRLATAHKAVLGTLQKHFSACASARCSRPLPAELALLVERLVLLGTQLHIDGDQGELLEDIKDLGRTDSSHVRTPLRRKWKKTAESSGNPSHSGRNHSHSGGNKRRTVPSHTPYKKHLFREEGKTATAHVSTSTQQKPSYSNKGGKVTSLSLPKPPISPSPSLPQKPPLNGPRTQGPFAPIAEVAGRGRQSGQGRVPKAASLSCATQTDQGVPDVDELRRWVELESQGLSYRLDRQPQIEARGLTPKELDPFTEESQLPEALLSVSGTRAKPALIFTRTVQPPSAGVVGDSQGVTAHDPVGVTNHNPMGVPTHNTVGVPAHNCMEDTAHECTKLEATTCGKCEAKSLLHQQELEAMLTQLDGFEAEEQVIRQRWTSLAYEDTFHQTVAEDSTSHQPRSQPLSLPAVTLASIQQYRAAHEHYLEMTGIRTAGNFNPWKLVESIADQLLDEQLGHVAAELADVCDKCVDGLYSAEFTIPLDTAHT